MIRVFGYGSLMYEPELADRVVERRVGTLRGWRRRFNKRSISRGCPADRARGPGLDGWLWEGDLRLSLVLGTEPDPDSAIVGEVLGYPIELAPALLARLRAREGPGYRKEIVTVETDQGPLQAWTWLTDPDSELIVSLDPDTKARVLRTATPTASPDGRARGAEYLRHTVRHLAALGVSDPYLDDLLARVDATPMS